MVETSGILADVIQCVIKRGLVGADDCDLRGVKGSQQPKRGGDHFTDQRRHAQNFALKHGKRLFW